MDVAESSSLGSEEPLHITDFPTELLLHIFSFLEVPDLIQVGQVCRLFSAISTDPYLWTYIRKLHISPSAGKEIVKKYVLQCTHLEDFRCAGNPDFDDQLFEQFLAHLRRMAHARWKQRGIVEEQDGHDDENDMSSFRFSSLESSSSSSSSSSSNSSSSRVSSAASAAMKETFAKQSAIVRKIPLSTLRRLDIRNTGVSTGYAGLLTGHFRKMSELRVSSTEHGNFRMNHDINDEFLGRFLSMNKATLEVLSLDNCSVSFHSMFEVPFLSALRQNAADAPNRAHRAQPQALRRRILQGLQQPQDFRRRQRSDSDEDMDFVDDMDDDDDGDDEDERDFRARGGRGAQRGEAEIRPQLVCSKVHSLNVRFTVPAHLGVGTTVNAATLVQLFPNVLRASLTIANWNRLIPVGRWAHLNALDISSSNIPSLQIAEEGSFPQLHILIANNCSNLQSCQIHHPKMESLSFEGCGRLMEIRIDVASLQHLSLMSCCTLTDIQSMNCPSLRSVNIAGCEKLTSSAVEHLLDESKMKIQNVNLSGVPAALKVLGRRETPWESVNALSVTSTEIFEKFTHPIFPNLKEIDFRSARFLKHEGLLNIVQQGESLLTHVDLSHVAFGDEVISAIASRHNSTLVSLLLKGCKGIKTVSVRDAPHLAVIDLEGCTSIQNLLVENCLALESINVEYNSSLTELSIIGAPLLSDLRTSGVGIFSSLSLECASLPSLQLHGLTESATLQLQLPNLTKLAMTKCALSAVVMQAILRGCQALSSVELIACTGIKNIEINHNTLEYLRVLGGMRKTQDLVIKGCQSLHTLCIAWCALGTNKDYQALLRENHSISNFQLSGITKIREFAIQSNELEQVSVTNMTMLKTIKWDCPNATSCRASNCARVESVSLHSSRLRLLYLQLPNMKTLHLRQVEDDIAPMIRDVLVMCPKVIEIHLEECVLHDLQWLVPSQLEPIQMDTKDMEREFGNEKGKKRGIDDFEEVRERSSDSDEMDYEKFEEDEGEDTEEGEEDREEEDFTLMHRSRPVFHSKVILQLTFCTTLPRSLPVPTSVREDILGYLPSSSTVSETPDEQGRFVVTARIEMGPS